MQNKNEYIPTYDDLRERERVFLGSDQENQKEYGRALSAILDLMDSGKELQEAAREYYNQIKPLISINPEYGFRLKEAYLWVH